MFSSHSQQETKYCLCISQKVKLFLWFKFHNRCLLWCPFTQISTVSVSQNFPSFFFCPPTDTCTGPDLYIHPALKHCQHCSCDMEDKDLPVRMQRRWRCNLRNNPRSASLCRCRRWSPAVSPCRTNSRRWRPCLSQGLPAAPRASHTYRCDILLSSPWPAEDESCSK